ncbi:hypothetical protein B0I37DRAFT_66828 [Chaetomium sp. MPI-CAGE-AT-0009]|nr:hypothetical protein B0I37DRAFT_66828 [Chaetomium sp. MPI-CAGE-AT-0009]
MLASQRTLLTLGLRITGITYCLQSSFLEIVLCYQEHCVNITLKDGRDMFNLGRGNCCISENPWPVPECTINDWSGNCYLVLWFVGENLFS